MSNWQIRSTLELSSLFSYNVLGSSSPTQNTQRACPRLGFQLKSKCSENDISYVHENIQNGIISRIIGNFCDYYSLFVGKSKLKRAKKIGHHFFIVIKTHLQSIQL